MENWKKNVWQIISMSESSRVKCGWCSCCAKLKCLQGLWLCGGEISATVTVVDPARSNYVSSHCFLCHKVFPTLTVGTCTFIQVTLEALFTRNNQQQKLSLSILRWTQPITDHILWNVLLAPFSSGYVTLSHTMKPHSLTLSLPLPMPFCHLPGSLSQFFTYLSPFPRLERGTTGA